MYFKLSILFLFVLLFSCNVLSEDMTENEIGELVKSVEYLCDHKIYGENYWQSPSETMEKMTGDCEDYCILYMKLYYDNFGIKLSMVRVAGVDRDHALILKDGQLFEPQSNSLFKDQDAEIKSTYGYDLTMFIATRIGTKEYERS
jgi:hypothetical protein